MKNTFRFLIIAVALLEVFGDILFKEWTIQNKKILIFFGVILYMIATLLWALSLKYQNLSKSVVIFALLTLIIGVLVGVFVYKETLNITNIVGIFLGLASIFLLEI